MNENEHWMTVRHNTKGLVIRISSDGLRVVFGTPSSNSCNVFCGENPVVAIDYEVIEGNDREPRLVDTLNLELR